MSKISIRSAILGILIGLLIFYLASMALTALQPGKQDQPVGYSKAEFSTKAGGAPSKYAQREIQSTDEASDELAKGVPGYGRTEGTHSIGQPGSYSPGSYSDAALTKLKMPALDEKIIRTANIEVQVKKGEFNSSYDRAVTIARSVGGFVSQSKSLATNNNIASGEIIMRIPAQDFETVLADLKRLGKVKSIDISSEDVSEEYVDLKSRLKHWRAQEAVMLDLMGKAKSISESITIQNNLSQIQMEIEKISGRLNFLENRTSYATIRLYMAEPQVAVRADKWGFKAAIRSAIQACANVISSFIVLMGYILPLALLTGIGYAVYRPIANIVSVRRRVPDIDTVHDR
ncbi:MAG: DUF4349 domain-containing protein [Actinobacteria bacterium]|nr:DUF4349 domain-containing protein [Actinomycetota bacterium]